MVLSFYEILCFIAITQLLLFSIFLVSPKKGNSLSNKLLAVFLFSKCLGIIQHLFFRLNIQNPHIYFIFVPFAFLWGPSLYFYIRSLVYKDFHLKKQHVIHSIPFTFAWIYFIFVYHIQSFETKTQILATARDYVSISQILFVGVLHFSIAAYMCASIFLLLKYRKNLKQHFSSHEDVSFSWLHIVLLGFIFIWLVDVVAFVVANISSQNLILYSIALVLTFIFANIIVYKGLKQPEIFGGIEQKPKYQQSPLTKKEKEMYLKKLQNYMQKERPYLNPGLSINRLSRQLVIPSRYLSQVINESLGVSFYDYINSYRVEEAKNLFMDSSNNDRSILELLFDAGFNTKSVFNRVFKKYTGMTPSEFKRIHPG
jgi:AraC-like DNA-binding protein